MNPPPDYPTDATEVDQTSIHEAAELALAGMLTPDRPHYNALRPKAITGLLSIWTTHRNLPTGNTARATALQLGADKRRFDTHPRPRITSGGLPGLGRRA